MKLVIFRHGETDGNVRNIVQGAGIDCPLNETGKKQAALLRDRLASEKLPAIYCSHLCRARETAEIVASSNHAPVIERDGLEEVHYGIAEGMLSAEAHVKFAAVLEAINDKSNPNRFDVSIPGAETIRSSTERGLKALMKIKADCPYPVAGVATHGALMFNLYYHFSKPSAALPTVSILKSKFRTPVPGECSRSFFYDEKPNHKKQTG